MFHLIHTVVINSKIKKSYLFLTEINMSSDKQLFTCQWFRVRNYRKLEYMNYFRSSLSFEPDLSFTSEKFKSEWIKCFTITTNYYFCWKRKISVSSTRAVNIATTPCNTWITLRMKNKWYIKWHTSRSHVDSNRRPISAQQCTTLFWTLPIHQE